MEGVESPVGGARRTPRGGRGHHTLIVVREFRRVPLDASTLALVVFTARPGYAAPTVAALAEFTGQAVSFYQPAYVLLARSLEDPQTVVLLTGVQDCAALEAASTSAFSIERLLPELSPMLVAEPEFYVYCPDRALVDKDLEPVFARRVV
ncbi:MAG: hypothetical protein DMD81_01030 [Candidatus Rokuibacteriota bacterium]|nr:MAG: hypothetical protein DMD81_01030 [Candidatus Rokubacteria bacterium]